MENTLTRRAALSTALAALGSSAFAVAPLNSLRPVARPTASPDILGGAAAVIRSFSLTGQVSCALMDPENGRLLDAYLPETELPPASVTKALTAAYGLQKLGRDFQFITGLSLQGRVVNGVLVGDIILTGSADPTLHTDDLVNFAKALQKTGIQRVKGRLVIADNGFPYQREIDSSQLPQANYNPAIAGVNLNLNRVQFEWARQAGGGYDLSMSAPGRIYRPQIPSIGMRVEERAAPSYAYQHAPEREQWSVQRAVLGKDGGRWLPARNPRRYAGEAFQAICAQMGMELPSPTIVEGQIPDAVMAVDIAQKESRPYYDIAKSMLKLSTNLTAEVIGLTASGAPTLRQSALALSQFAQAHGMRGAVVDHSGLSDQSRLTAGGLAMFMAWHHRNGLADLLKPKILRHKGKPMDGVDLRVKTGTLNFVSSLSGYLTYKGKSLGFAILTADMARREKVKGSENPRGAKGWEARSRSLQYAILRDWLGHLR
jgi:D-alanyl-D-alanine carboxypeptidase/D-alanyl-D-alanine-endopeptidase (penicillin-binding protein 4)